MSIDYKMNNKAVSGVVAAVIMIALVIAISGIVWVVVQNLVSEQLSEAGTCLEVLDKVTINNQYTCYDSTSAEFLFAIGIGDINIEKVIVSISGEGTTKSYEISKESSESSESLTNYTGGDYVVIPNKNEGLTYRLNTTSEGLGRPDSIKIYPVLSGRQCDSTDSLSEISSCFLL